MEWYLSDYATPSVIEFLRSCLALFSMSLSALMQNNLFSFFLAFALFATVVALFYRLTRMNRQGAKL